MIFSSYRDLLLIVHHNDNIGAYMTNTISYEKDNTHTQHIE